MRHIKLCDERPVSDPDFQTADGDQANQSAVRCLSQASGRSAVSSPVLA